MECHSSPCSPKETLLESLDLPKFASVLRESHVRQIPSLKQLGPGWNAGCIQNCHLWFQLEVGNIRNNVGIYAMFFFNDLIHNLSGFSITDIALVSECFSTYMIGTATRRSKIKHDTWWSYDHLLISRDPKTWRVLRRTKVNTENFFAWDPDVYLDQLMIY